MAHTIVTLDRVGLRKFALSTGIIVAGLFGGFLPWVFNFDYPWWPWVFLLIFALWGIVAPSTLGPIYKGWMRFGLLLSKVTTPIIMGTVFFLVLAPIALIYRCVSKRDPMNRVFDEASQSYRVESRSPIPDDFKRPF